MECYKYHSISIIKDTNILAETIKFHDVKILKMTPYKKFAVINIYMNNLYGGLTPAAPSLLSFCLIC